MDNLTKNMIKKYALMKLRYDFMGYGFTCKNQLSFHHLIYSRNECKKMGLGKGREEWNGVILKRNTSHDYLHIIEKYDPDIYNYIKYILILENIQGYIDMDNIKKIDDVLNNFEKEYMYKTNKKGVLIVKPEYTERILKKFK